MVFIISVVGSRIVSPFYGRNMLKHLFNGLMKLGVHSGIFVRIFALPSSKYGIFKYN